MATEMHPKPYREEDTDYMKEYVGELFARMNIPTADQGNYYLSHMVKEWFDYEDSDECRITFVIRPNRGA